MNPGKQSASNGVDGNPHAPFERTVAPSSEQLAQAAAGFAPAEPRGVYTLTFTVSGEQVVYDTARIDRHAIAEWGLPTVLRAFALGFTRLPGFYTGIVGYGVHVAVTGVTICADVYGDAAATAPPGADVDPHGPLVGSLSSVRRALITMVENGPGLREPQPHTSATDRRSTR